MVKFEIIAPYKKCVDNPSRKGFWKALHKKTVEHCQ